MSIIKLIKNKSWIWKYIFSPFVRRFSTILWKIRRYENIAFDKLSPDIADKMLFEAFLNWKKFESVT